MLSEFLTSLITLLEKALNWASPFFLGKTIQKSKDEKSGEEAIDAATQSRSSIHRVVASDNTGNRDQLRKWTRSE